MLMKNQIRKLEDLSDEQRDRIVFGIMHMEFGPKVRDNILNEVIRFKWLDCENIGIDIYSEIDCLEEQLIAAGLEWRRNHWQDFFESNDTEGKDQLRKMPR